MAIQCAPSKTSHCAFISTNFPFKMFGVPFDYIPKKDPFLRHFFPDFASTSLGVHFLRSEKFSNVFCCFSSERRNKGPA